MASGRSDYSTRHGKLVPPYRIELFMPVTKSGLILFQRDDCHLCDLALDVLAQARVPEFESVFIDGDDELEARYGIRVPVLRDEERDAELEWPFDAEQLQRWLGLHKT
jgi:hypothetical protein